MRNRLKIYQKYLTTPGRSIFHGGLIAVVLLGILLLAGGFSAPGKWMILPAVLVVAAGMVGGLVNHFIFPIKFKAPRFRLLPRLIGGVIYIMIVGVAIVLGMNGNI